MDIRTSTTLCIIDHTPVVQLNTLYISGIDHLSDAMIFPDESIDEFPGGSYCPLPEYCRIEDKWKYLAGILK